MSGLSEAPSHGLPALVYDHLCWQPRLYGAGPRTDFPPARKKEGGMSDDPIIP
jgi:hypothetical protein